MSRRVQGKLVYPLWPRFADNDPDIKNDQGLWGANRAAMRSGRCSISVESVLS